MGKLYSMQRGEAAAHLPVLAVPFYLKFDRGENTNAYFNQYCAKQSVLTQASASFVFSLTNNDLPDLWRS